MSNTVEVFINGSENVSGAVAKVKAALKKLKDEKIKIKVDVDTKKAEKAIKGLKEQADGLGNGVDLEIDTSKARKKLDRLLEKKDKFTESTKVELDAGPANSKLDRLLDKKNKFSDSTKIELDAGPANSKLDRLAQKKDKIFSESTKIEVDVDDARSKLKELGDETKNIRINIDADSAIEDIEDINMALDSLDDHKTINIDVDTGNALRKIAALDAAINGIDNHSSRVDVDIDVDDVELLKLKGELAALKSNRDKIEVGIETNLIVDEDRIKELEDRIAEKQRLRIKAEVDDSELVDSGLRDKTITIEAIVKGMARVEMLHKMISQINDKTVTINANVNERSLARVKDATNSISTTASRPVVIDIDADTKKFTRKLRNSPEVEAAARDLADVMNKAFDDKQFDSKKLDSYKRKLDRINAGLVPRMNFEIENQKWIDQLNKDIEKIESKSIYFRTDYDRSMLNELRDALSELQNTQRRRIAENDRAIVKRDDLTGKIKDIENERRYVTIRADADVAAAEAALRALTRPRTADIDTNIKESNFRTITTYFRDIGNAAGDAGRRISSAFEDDDSGLSRSLRNVSRFGDGINKGIGKMTSRIPIVGGLFNAMASLGGAVGGVTTKLGGLAGMSPKAAGAMGGVAQAVVSVASAMVGLGIVGIVGTGAITAGAYATTAALGTVAGVIGAVGAAIGGASIAGFAALVKDVPVVQEAYKKLGDSVGASMKQLAMPVAIPIADAAPKLQAAFDQMAPSIGKIASKTGELVNELGGKLPAVAAQAGPAMEKAFDFGAKSLNSLMDNMPGITKAIGEFFGKMDSPEVSKAVNGAFAAIPGIIGGIGTGLEKAAAGFNNMQEFMSSDKLDPMREGFDKFRQSLAGTDWSSASDGFTNAMNSFGQFAGNIDMQNISDGIGGVANAFANLTDIADSMNLDGLFAGFGKLADFGTDLLPRIAESFGLGGSVFTEPLKKAFDGIGNFIDDNFNMGGTQSVDGPSIELNPNISVKDDAAAKAAQQILDNIDGKSFGSADAAERIIGGLQDDIEKVAVKPQIAPIIDDANIAKNINSSNIGKLLQNRIGEGSENAIKIPFNTAIAIDNAAGDDGINALDSIKDQLSKLTGIAFDDINITIPVQTEYAIADGGANIGDVIKSSIDSSGNLTQVVVMEAEVVARVAGITGLDGANLDSILGATLGGETISAEVAVQIKAAMGLADVSMADFEGKLEGALSQATGKSYDVKINANGSVTIGEIAPPEIPEIPMPEGSLPEITWQQEIEIATTFNYDNSEVDVAREELRALGLEGGEAIEITQEAQIKLEAIVGSDGDVQGKIKALLAEYTGLSAEEIDVIFKLNPKPTLGDGNGAGGIMGNIGSQIQGQIGAAAGAGIEANVPVTVKAQIKGVEDVSAKIKESIAYKGGAAEVQTQQIKVQLIPDFTAIAGVLAGGVPMKVILIPDFTAIAGILGSGVPMKVILVPDFSAVAGILGAGVPMRVILVPDLSALGTLPPILVPIIPDLSGIGAIGGLTLPPIRVPVVFDIGQMPSFGDTTSTHRVVVTADPLPSFPNTTSGHHVNVTADSLPSFPNTTSTHTINVVVNGSTSVGGGASARAAAMGAALAPISSQARGSSIPMGAGPGMSGGGRGVGQIRSAGEAIAGSFAEGLRAGAGKVQEAANELVKAAEAIPEVQAAKAAGAKIASDVAQGISSAQGQVDSALKGINDSFNGALGEADKFLSANVPGYDVAKKQFEGLQKAAGVAASEFQKIVSEEFQLPPIDQILGGAAQLADGAFKALLGDPSQLNGTISQMGDAIGSKIATIQTKVGEAMSKVHQSLVENVPGYKEASEQVQGFVKGFQDTIGGLNEAAQVGATGFQKIFEEEFKLPPMEDIIAKAQEIGDGIGQALAGDPSKLAGTMDGLGQAIGSKIETVATKVGQVMDQVNQTMRDKVPGFADAQNKAIEFGNGLAAGVENARVQMNQQLASMGLPQIPTPQVAAEGLAAEITKVKTAIEGGIRGLLVQAPAPVVPAPDLNPVMQALSQIPGVIPTINRVQSDAARVVADIDKIPAVVDTKNAIQSNADKIKQAINQLKTNTASKHTVKIAVQGAGAVASATKSRGATAMGSALGNARGIGAMGAGVSSSSNVSNGTFNIGQSISMGIADGILSGLPYVENSIGRLQNAMLAVQDVFSNKTVAVGLVKGAATNYGKVIDLSKKFSYDLQSANPLLFSNFAEGKYYKPFSVNIKTSGGTGGGSSSVTVGKIEMETRPWNSIIDKQIKTSLDNVQFSIPFKTTAGMTSGWNPHSFMGTFYDQLLGPQEQQIYYHYENTNYFDGGVLGDPERQANVILDILEQSPNQRRIRKVIS